MLKVCVNGARRRPEHAGLPVTPDELAAAARGAVSAGADAIHLHPKDEDGSDTLDAGAVAAVLQAVRAAVPGVAVGITTGAWAGGGDRIAAVASWTVLPDFASVNWHEAGAASLAETLLERGVGVEAGLWCPQAISAWRTWPLRESCLRVLLEVGDVPALRSVAAAQELLDALGDANGIEVLLHGEDRSAWPVITHAAHLGLACRIGLEDVLVLPDGTVAEDNAVLVRAAHAIISQNA